MENIFTMVSWKIYLLPLLVITVVYLLKNHVKTVKNRRIKNAAINSGMTEPASLHPQINSALCIGCNSCATACPEKHNHVLGVINGKVELLNPTHCIGHGACKTACPVGAISLVFGTAKRGVDIPFVKPDFETNVKDIFIAGELGGMGLIRNAVEQGKQAMETIIKKRYAKREGYIDCLIVGAGPAGIAASLAAKAAGLEYATVEQDSMGGTVAHFPRGKLVMTAPVNLPLYGAVNLRETTKEHLLELWEKVIDQAGLDIHYKHRVESVEPLQHGYKVVTNHNEYKTRSVLLTIGRRGTPRKLNVPGENKHKVVYRLIDPEQYRGQHVLVVGGGDSALEAACSIAEEEGTTVSLSYRSAAFSRAKEKNRQRVENLAANNKLNILYESQVESISDDSVVINVKEEQLTLKNDVVIVCAGGILPTQFLQNMGIEVETKYGTA